MADNFFITAILVSHDGQTWLPESIASLSAQTRRIDRIIAVDTGSIDSSAKMISILKNKNIKNVKALQLELREGDISNQFDDLNVEELKKKYSHLTNKISYIEEIFEKFKTRKKFAIRSLEKNMLTVEQDEEICGLDTMLRVETIRNIRVKNHVADLINEFYPDNL